MDFTDIECVLINFEAFPETSVVVITSTSGSAIYKFSCVYLENPFFGLWWGQKKNINSLNYFADFWSCADTFFHSIYR